MKLSGSGCRMVEEFEGKGLKYDEAVDKMIEREIDRGDRDLDRTA